MSIETPIVGAKNYAVLVDESSWGTFPGGPTYIHVPVTDYGVKWQPVNRQAKPFAGLLQRKHSRNIKGMVGGALNTQLFGWQPTGLTMSLAQYLLTWGFSNPETLDLASKSAEWAEGPNISNKRHIGLRCNGATLSGSEDSGIALSLDLQGRDELGQATVTTAQTLPNDRNRMVEFLFEHCTCELNGAEIPIGGFSWTVNRSLVGRYYNNTRLQTLRATDFKSTLSLTKPKEDDTWDAALRALDPDDANTVSLTLLGLHMGTGEADTEWTQVVIDFNLLSLVNAETQGGRDGLHDSTLTFELLKPDTADNCFDMTWTDEA